MKKKRDVLTEEEKKILILATLPPDGIHLDNRESSRRLGIPVVRIKTLIHQACIKLEAKNRNQAILFAIRKGEIGVDELLSLDELVEILSSLGPDKLWEIARLMRRYLEHGTLSAEDKLVIQIDRREDSVLTNREREVLILVGNGMSNQEIAEKLWISPSAVRAFLYRAFKKLGTNKRADAFVSALKQKEICISEISTLEELLNFLVPFGAEFIERIAFVLDNKYGKEPGLLPDNSK